MHALWSRQFGIGLAAFAVPTALAARLAYGKLRKSILCRQSARRTVRVESLRRLLEDQEPQPVSAPAIPRTRSRPEVIHQR